VPRPRKITPPERVNAGIRFPVALYRRLQAEAAERRVSVNRLVEWAVEDWLNCKGDHHRK